MHVRILAKISLYLRHDPPPACMSVLRLHECDNAVPTGRISLKFDTGDFHKNIEHFT